MYDSTITAVRTENTKKYDIVTGMITSEEYHDVAVKSMMLSDARHVGGKRQAFSFP
jgi:hypothetical protein